MNEPSLLSNCTSGGCGAKIGPGELRGILGKLPAFTDPNLLVGFDGADDAAVYRLNDTQSLISTTDFFSPMVEDPRRFGRVVAANAMSDVWAMGGVPRLALNLVCFPEGMNMEILGEVLAGGAEKISEAGAVLGGGHSIYDKELKYGLAVTGLVETAKVVRNNTPRPGDMLVLTKPLGVGIILAAARAKLATADALEAAVCSMERLNRYAAEKMGAYDVGACTDVTGFGLLAHAAEMAAGQVTFRLDVEALPALPHALDYAEEYLLTAAGQRNRNYLAGTVEVGGLPFAKQELMFDPQTSGGLLVAVASLQAQAFLQAIKVDDPYAAIIGDVIPRGESPIIFE